MAPLLTVILPVNNILPGNVGASQFLVYLDSDAFMMFDKYEQQNVSLMIQF